MVLPSIGHAIIIRWVWHAQGGHVIAVIIGRHGPMHGKGIGKVIVGVQWIEAVHYVEISWQEQKVIDTMCSLSDRRATKLPAPVAMCCNIDRVLRSK